MTNTFTYSDELFSDLHKDVHGFRPRGHIFYVSTPAQKQVMWDSLCDQLEVNEENDIKEYVKAEADFEARITKLLSAGAQTPEIAIRWLAESLDNDFMEEFYGAEYLEYTLGLRFSYIAKNYPEYNVKGKR